jgi:hypothetical protein
MTTSPEDTGGPAFPPTHDPATHPSGMTLRDYFAAHSVQPGCGEIATVAGLRYSAGAVWSDEVTRVGSFDDWFNGLPLSRRLDLFARVKFAMADAMLKARKT